MNKVFLIGNLTRDPELRTTANGVSMCKFGLAVNRRRKVEGQPEVDFFNVTAWRGLGENVARYLSKGRKCCVVGSISARMYDAQDGSKRLSLDVDAEDVEFLPNANQAAEGAAYDSVGTGYTPAAASPGVPPAASAAPAPYAQPAESGFTEIDEDELPF